MKNLFIIMIVLLCIANTDNRADDYNFYEPGILKDSKIEYTLTLGGITIHDSPKIFKYSVICKKKKVKEIFVSEWFDGKEKKKTYKGCLKEYLNLWRTILEFDIWKLHSYDQLKIESSKLLSIYKDLRLDKSEFKFYFKVKNREHSCEVYDIFQLRDERYVKILNAIEKYLKIKNEVE